MPGFYGYVVQPDKLKYVVGPTNDPMPSKYWITANQHDSNHKPIGLVVADRKLYSFGDGLSPIIGMDTSGRIVVTDRYSLTDMSRFQWAVSGTHLLISKGSLVTSLLHSSTDRRSAIGVRKDGSVVHVVTTERVSLHGLALAMLSLGCVDAIQMNQGGTFVRDGQTMMGSYPVATLLGADVAEELSRPFFVVDAGHGGKEPGARSPMLPQPEKYYNLGLALSTAIKLRQYTCTVLLTRDSDVTVSLADRVALANTVDADLFVSWHNNAAGGRGFESFIRLKPLPAEVETQKTVHAALARTAATFGEPDRGLKREGFYVLRNAAGPSILLEGAFMDQQDDADLIRRVDWTNAMSTALVDALVAQFRLLQQNHGPVSPYTVEIPCKSAEEAKATADNLRALGYRVYVKGR